MHDPEEQYPERLAEALGGLGRAGRPFPPEVDAAILAAAGRQLARQRRLSRMLRWGSGMAAAAAVLLIGLRVAVFSPDPPPGPPAIVLAKDINRDGQVDILDALALARRIERGEPLDPAWDFTGSGAVDQRDVEAIAMAAVRLDQEAVR